MSARRTCIGALTFIAASSAATVALGQSAIQRGLYRLSENLGNQNLITSPQGGPLFNNNLFDQRIMWNRLGNGFTYDSFRFFGSDSFDNPNAFDFGALKIQLGRDPTILGSPQPVGIHTSAGYTTKLIPEVTFSTRTGQRAFDIFSGQTNFAAAPLHYDVQLFTGVQNFHYSGNMLVDTNGRINALGFYDVTARITNTGNAESDGMIVKDEKVTDFDTGPVRLSGNIVADVIGSAFQSAGAPLVAASPRIFSGASAKDKKTEDLLAKVQAGEKLSNDDMGYLVQQMILAAFQNDPLGFLINGMPSTVPGFEDLALKTYQPPVNGVDPGYLQASADAGNAALAAQQGQGAVPAAASTENLVPEPGTLVLVGIVLVSMGAMRSFRRRYR